MSYYIVIDNISLDLFPNQDIEISLDYYDSDSPDSIKLPFSYSGKIPFTSKNKQALGYTASTYASIPTAENSYTIYEDEDVVSVGKAIISSVVLNSTEPYFQIDFRDNVSEFSRKLRELTFSDLYDDASSAQVRGLGTYLTFNQGYNGRDIEIPFIDFDNIQSVTGYESRQFISWGIDGKKFGLMPALKITNFFERVFDKLGFDYDSKFLAGTGTWKPNNLYMLYPTYLSEEVTSKRESFLFPFPYNVEYNIDQYNIDGDIMVAEYEGNVIPISNYKLTLRETYEPFGPTNYTPTEAVVSREFGDQLRTSSGVADYGDEGIGYTSYGSSFNANIEFMSGSVSVSGLKACFLTTEQEYDDKILPHVISITSTANAVFVPYVLIYESFQTSSAPTYRIPMLDAGGNKINLSVSGVVPNSGLDAHNIPGAAQVNSTVQFFPFTARIDEAQEYLINGGSRYSYSIGIAIESGYITAATSIIANVFIGNMYQLQAVNVTTGVQITQIDVSKQRVFGYDWSALGIKIDNAGNLPATVPGDSFSFQRSLENNTSISVYETFIDLMNRFGLGLIYDYSGGYGQLLLDYPEDIRNGTVNIDPYIDDLRPFEVFAPQRPFKTLKLINELKKGLYDKNKAGNAVGSFDGEFNPDGNGELSIEFKSSLINSINKSLCLPDVGFDDAILNQDGLIPKEEVGGVKNQIPNFDEVGVRIMYLRQPSFPTTLRYPVFKHTNDYNQVIDQVVYKPFGPITLNGYPVNDLPGVNELDLRWQYEDGTTTDGFTYLTESERFFASYKAKMTLYIGLPSLHFKNGYIYSKKYKFLTTDETFIIASFTDARLYNKYVYGKAEIIFVD